MPLEIVAAEDFESQTPEESFVRLSSSAEGLSGAEAEKRLERYGPNELEEKKANALLQFLGYFWGPIPWMIEVAAVLSLVVHHWADFVIISVLLVFNAAIGFWQEHQAANAVEALKEQLALKARALRDGTWQSLAARELVPGDVIRIRLGEILPADVKLVRGEFLSVDQSGLTGESLPVDKLVGNVAYAGSVAKQGEMVALVTATGAQTKFARTAKLVEGAGAVSHFQKAVLAIGDYLVFTSLLLAGILVLTQILRGDSFITVFQFVLILVVAAIPVAMPAVLSVTMALGALTLSRLKAIVSRLQSIEEIAGIDVLCSDKTGTLTQNKLTLGEPRSFTQGGALDPVLAGALASRTEFMDPIDLAVTSGLADQSLLGRYQQIQFQPFDPVHKRTEATVRDEEGRTFKVSKGAPQVIVGLCHLRGETKQTVERSVDEFAGRGYRTLGVAYADGGSDAWKFLGLLPLYDPPREDSADTIRRAREHGIDVKMVTGDNVAIAKEIARQLELPADVRSAEEMFGRSPELEHPAPELISAIEKSDGFAEVYPEHKYGIVKALQAQGHLVAMTGDGVNDAPALKQADVGIAVSGATNAAQAAASLVLTGSGLSVIIRAVEEARRIFERMNSYAIYRITETIRIMFFVVLAMIVFNFYPITTVMIILLALLNDLPILTIAYDNTWLDPKPVRWEMQRVLTVATALGLIGVLETFGLLTIVRVFFDLSAAQIQSLIYLKLAVAGHLTLFVARTRRSFLSKPHPAPVLMAAVLGTQILAALIVGFGWIVAALPWSYIGLVWAYCLVWVFIEDWAKLQVYHHIEMSGSWHRAFLDRVSAGPLAWRSGPASRQPVQHT